MEGILDRVRALALQAIDFPKYRNEDPFVILRAIIDIEEHRFYEFMRSSIFDKGNDD